MESRQSSQGQCYQEKSHARQEIERGFCVGELTSLPSHHRQGTALRHTAERRADSRINLLAGSRSGDVEARRNSSRRNRYGARNDRLRRFAASEGYHDLVFVNLFSVFFWNDLV
jgi:hypothetical protein